MHRHAWATSLLATFSKDRARFESDPDVQYRIHMVFTYVWLVNMAVAVAVFSLAPAVWAKWSVLYLVIVSLYANFATDYGAVSAAEAAQHQNAAGKQQTP